MNQQTGQNWIIVGISALSIILAVVFAYATYMGYIISNTLFYIWSVVFAAMLAFWTGRDARGRDLYKPFEYLYVVFLFWPVVLLYYLPKTRSYEGFLMFVGIVGLYLLPLFCELLTWVYFVQ